MAVEVIRSKKRAQGRPAKVWEFGLEFYRGDVPVVHEFKAYPSLDAGSLNTTLAATHAPEQAISGMVRSIRKMLADDDGTPADYRPTRYVEPEDDDPADLDDADLSDDEARDRVRDADMPEGWQEAARAGWQENPVAQAAGLDGLPEGWTPVLPEQDDDPEEDPDLLFVGPLGDPITGEAVTEALKFENGSSRRRFAYLMDEDESLTLDVEQLQATYKKLLARAADRPTRR